jgi:DUF971 family protein
MTRTYPTDLKRLDDENLLIEWSDGQRRRYSFDELRQRCPCATCREQRGRGEREQLARTSTALPVIPAAQAQPLRVVGMKPVGNYAYNIVFSDGHNTGIYPFELLRQLGQEVT